MLDQAIDGLIIKAEVQYGVHHARHGHRSAGANRNEQRIFCVADFLANALFKVEVFLDGVQNAFGPGIVGVCILHASLAGNRESRRYRQSDVSHLSKVSALAAKDGLHVGVALRNVLPICVFAKSVDALKLVCHHLLLRLKHFSLISPVQKPEDERFHNTARFLALFPQLPCCRYEQ